jgi:ABC-2 type transport system permease protein
MTATGTHAGHGGSLILPRAKLGGGVRQAFRAERRKLVGQLPTRLVGLVCVLGPFAFAAILKVQSSVPADTLFGMWVHQSGFAIPLVVLSFAGSWGFPVLAGVLAGDIFSADDRYGTWKTVLTRSCSRRELFAGKVLAAAMFSLAMLALVAVSSLLAGLLLIGDQPLVSLSGTVISPGRCLVLLLLSWLTSAPPMLAFVSLAVLVSVLSRNGIVGVLGPVLVALAMQLLALVGTGYWVHTWLVASAFDSWHGLFTSPAFYRPLMLGIIVSVAWVVVCLSVSWSVLRGRDFAGPPVSRRAGWVAPVRVVVVCSALIALLAVACSWGPVSVTTARLQAAIKPTFNNLIVLQQRALGRHIPAGARLNDYASCVRRSGLRQGPGEDWICTMDMVIPLDGPTPFSLTPVTFDVSVKANGCYKAQGPPAFIGQPEIRNAHGTNVVNPLYAFDGCFDPT